MVLNLANNNIDSLGRLEPLKQLHGLKEMTLAGNPLSAGSNFPDCIFEMFPNLDYLDDWWDLFLWLEN